MSREAEDAPDGSRVAVVLVSAIKECPKCRACEAMIGRIMRDHPGQIGFTKVRADAPEAADYGVVMPPMLVIDGFVACAGRVPIESGVRKLIARKLVEGGSA